MKVDNRMTTSLARTILCLASLLPLVGCGGGSGPERVAVEGKVERSGEPMWGSSISFLPADGNDGPAATANIEDGHYAFTRDNGPVAGPHRVLIRINSQSGGLRAEIEGRQADRKAPPAPGGPWQFDMDIPEESSYQKDFTLE